MTTLPKIRVKYGENIGVELYIQPPDLNENKATFLNTDSPLGSGTFTVENGSKFAVDEYIAVIPSVIGSEKAEILKLHASTTPTSTTLTLASNSIFGHSRGEKVVFIPYNQILIEYSTDGGATYSTLDTVSLKIDSPETFYSHSAGLSTTYYRAKFKNSTSSNTSQVSDPVVGTGYADNTAGLVIRQALLSLGESIDGEVLTKEFLFQALHEGREQVDNDPLVRRWSFRSIKDYDLGDMIPGRNSMAVPTNLREPSTYENVLSLRLGKNNRDLIPSDIRTINDFYNGVAHSTLSGAITNVSTSIVLASSGDFDASGSVDISAETVSGTIDNATYTSNTKSSNTLGTVDSIADSHASGRDVWQNARFGLPTHYTVDNGYIYFSCPFSNNEAGQNVKMDYYAKLTRANSDGDVLDEPWASTVYTPYLKWRIKHRKDPSLQQDTDSDWKDYKTASAGVIAKAFGGQDMRIVYSFRR